MAREQAEILVLKLLQIIMYCTYTFYSEWVLSECVALKCKISDPGGSRWPPVTSIR